MNDNGVKASTPAALLNDSQMGTPKDGMTLVNHGARAMRHVSSNRTLQWQPNVSQQFMDTGNNHLASSKFVEERSAT